MIGKTESISELYENLLTARKELESKLSALANKVYPHRKNLPAEIITEGEVIVEILDRYGRTIELSHKAFIQAEKLIPDYQLELLAAYCFCFYVRGALNEILKQDAGLGNYLSVNHRVINLYMAVAKQVHLDAKIQYYVAYALTIFVENYNERESREEVFIFEKTLNLLTMFIGRIKESAVSLKLHCLMCKHLLQLNQDIVDIATKIDSKTPKANDLLKSVLPLCENQALPESKTILYYARAIYLLHQLINPLQHVSEKDLKTLAETGKLSNKNTIGKIKTAFVSMRRNIEESYIYESLDYIKAIMSIDELYCFELEIIFQLQDIVRNTNRSIFDCLSKIEEQCYLFADIFQKLGEWQLHRETLQLLKTVLQKLFIMDLANKDFNDEDLSYVNKVSLQKLDQINLELERLEQQVAKSEKEYLTLSKVQKAPRSSKLIKKIIREKQAREVFKRAKNQASNNENQRPMKIPPTNKRQIAPTNADLKASKAYEHFLKGELQEALRLYQELLKSEKNQNSLKAVNYLICLGDIHKKLSTSKEEVTSAKALEYYRKAENIALVGHLDPANQSEIQEQFATLNKLAKELADGMQIDTRDIIVSKNEQRGALKTTPKKPVQLVQAELTNVYKAPKVINKVLQIPRCVADIVDVFKENGAATFIVGDYVRETLLGRSSRDVHLTIFDTSGQRDVNTFYLFAQAVLAGKFESVVACVKKYPILLLQTTEHKVEISVLGNRFLYDNQQESKLDLFQMLFADSRMRITTENALYYDVVNNRLLDFATGYLDILRSNLRLVDKPQQLFQADTSSVSEMIHFINKRLISDASLKFDANIIESIRATAATRTLNKDAFYQEIMHLLFCGKMLNTWRFLEQHNLQGYFFLLPTDNELAALHSIMLSDWFSKLDKRILSGQRYSPGLVFAVILWGAFQEALKNCESATLTAAKVEAIADGILSKDKLTFNLPRSIGNHVKKVWCVYLTSNRIVSGFDKLDFTLEHSKQAFILGLFINKALKSIEENKAIRGQSKTIFFRGNQIESQLKQILRDHGFKLEKSASKFFVIFPNYTTLALNDRMELLMRVRDSLKNILGRFMIGYEIFQNKVILTVGSDRKQNHVETVFANLFPKEVEEQKCSPKMLSMV